MRDLTNDHFFACYLLWLGLRVGSLRLEVLLEDDEMAPRVDEFQIRQEEIGGWLMDELVKAGAGYVYKGRPEPLVNVEADELEQRLSASLKGVEELGASFAPPESPAPFVYLAECCWAAAVLRAFAAIEESLPIAGASAPYAEIATEVANQIDWLEGQQAELVSEAAMSPQRRDALTSAINALVHEWREMVFTYSDRYPRPPA